jgi:hypothetical protein
MVAWAHRDHVAVLHSNSKYESGFVCFWLQVIGAHSVKSFFCRRMMS